MDKSITNTVPPATGVKVQEGGACTPSETNATVQPAVGCTLAEYAGAKKLDADRLSEWGVSEIKRGGRPSIRMIYYDENKAEAVIRYRLRLHEGDDGETRFIWRKGSKLILYGLWRLDRKDDTVTLVEGESCSHTAWTHGINCLGMPGNTLKEERDAGHLERFRRINVVIEPGSSGQGLLKSIERCGFRGRVWLISLPKKDVSDLHVANPDAFMDEWRTALDIAIPWHEYWEKELDEARKAAWGRCRELAASTSILDRFGDDVAHNGLAGEQLNAKLLYLIVTSRVLDQPVSAIIKGPSSAGKSFLCNSVLRFFPASAFHALTAMSDRALVYSEEPMEHRFLVLYEIAGMEADMITYLIRSLLSEGCIRYEVVEKTKDGMKPRLIERPGPSGLITTTTKSATHPENETRMLSLTVTDTPDHTREVYRAITEEPGKVDLEPWIALQEWIGLCPAKVRVPFQKALAETVDTGAVRLRRDFGKILHLIAAHALLHRETRDRENGEIIATIEDYRAVFALVASLMAEGVEAAAPPTVRETVEAVRDLNPGVEGVQVTTIAERLGLDKSSASRRVTLARNKGFLDNAGEGSGRPAKIVLGDPLPEDRQILPTPDTLAAKQAEMDGCTVARKSEGV